MADHVIRISSIVLSGVGGGVMGVVARYYFHDMRVFWAMLIASSVAYLWGRLEEYMEMWQE